MRVVLASTNLRREDRKSVCRRDASANHGKYCNDVLVVRLSLGKEESLMSVMRHPAINGIQVLPDRVKFCVKQESSLNLFLFGARNVECSYERLYSVTL